MKVRLIKFVFLFFLLISAQTALAQARRFEVISFKPAIDASSYFSVYGSQNLEASQANLGLYLDYANRPLQFVGTGILAGRRGVVDHLLVADMFAAFGFTDWFEAGISLPLVPYNWFFRDDNGLANNGVSLGDLMLMTKLRIIDNENSKFGFSVMPFVSLPTGEEERYMSNGSITGGGTLIVDYKIHPRVDLALNMGVIVRDDVTRNNVTVDEQFNFGLGGNWEFAHDWVAILETYGRTTLKNFFKEEAETPLEAAGGVRYHIPDTGLNVSLGASVGILDGIGAPRARGFAGLQWTSEPKEEAPRARIEKNKIILTEKIYFDTDKATIKSQSFLILDDVIRILNENKKILLVEIQGHCDWRESEAYNLSLSQRRAEAVKDYLVGKGIDANRLMAKGYGETVPIADNHTALGMSLNRRVEFVILEEK